MIRSNALAPPGYAAQGPTVRTGGGPLGDSPRWVRMRVFDARSVTTAMKKSQPLQGMSPQEGFARTGAWAMA
ncbi:MAG: hypothetical protein WCJ30_17015 [Deltaproteobacteria bacterium]